MDGVEAEEWARWLGRMDWDFWATPTFRHPVTVSGMVAAVERWLGPIPGAYAAVGVQRGPFGNRLHVHALVGGVGRRLLRENLLRSSWRRGNLALAGYCPRRGGVGYLVRQADAIEFVGTPRPYRARRRGGRSRGIEGDGDS